MSRDSVLRLKDTLFELPSQGLVELGQPLVNGSYINIRPLLKGDQKVIAAPGASSYQVMFSLLDRIITSPKLDINRMLLSDAIATLFAVRLMSFGSQYKARYQCENCNEFNTAALDLNQLEVRYASEMERPFTATDLEVVLSDKTVIKYHLPTLDDEKRIAAHVKNMAKRDKNFEANSRYNQQLVRLTQLCDHVSAVGDEPEQAFTMRMRYFDEQLAMADEKRIWSAIYESDVGLVTESEHACSSCGYENAILLSIDNQFFRSADE